MDFEEAQAVVKRWMQALDSDEPIMLDEAGTCIIRSEYDPELVCEVSEDGSALGISAPLIQVSLDRREPVFGYSLALNMHQRFTRGGVLAYDPRSDAIVFTFAQPTVVDDAFDFARLVGEISATTAILRAELQNFSDSFDAPDMEDPQMAAQEATSFLEMPDVIIRA